MWLLFLKNLPFIFVGAALAAGLLAIVNFTVWLPQARDDGRKSYIAEQAVADKRIELERKNDDVKLQGMSDYDVCRLYLTGVSDCDSLKLRGLD